MVGKGRIQTRGGVDPDLVGAARLATKLEASARQALHDIPIAKAAEATHQALMISG
jgi:hypothetical protein